MTIPEPHDRPEVVRAKARVIILESVWKWFLIITVVVILGLVVTDTLQGKHVRHELLDCTRPNGHCYQEGQKRTGDIVKQLYQQGIDREQITRQIIVLAASCAGDERNVSAYAIEQCVNARLAAENRVRLPGND